MLAHSRHAKGEHIERRQYDEAKEKGRRPQTDPLLHIGRILTGRILKGIDPLDPALTRLAAQGVEVDFDTACTDHLLTIEAGKLFLFTAMGRHYSFNFQVE